MGGSEMLYDGLRGVYGVAASDRYGSVTLASLLGRAVSYTGSDGLRRTGTVSAIVDRDQDGRPCELRAVLQVGSASTWMSVAALVAA